MLIATAHIASNSHTQRSRECRTGMPRTVRVMLALCAQHKPIQPTWLPDRIELLRPSRQQLMHIRLMTHIKDKRILRRIEDIVHRNRQLNDAKVRPNMPTGLRDANDQTSTDLFRQLQQLGDRKLLYIRRRFNRVKNAAHEIWETTKRI